MKKIAVIFPGMGYGKDKPLLYFAAKLAKELGYEIRYTNYDEMPPMEGTDIEAKTRWTEAAYLMAAEQLTDIDWEGKDVVFIAKSVGTIVASKYAVDHNLQPVMILLTPLDETFAFLTGGRNIIFTGDKDPMIDISLHGEELESKVEEYFRYEGANHSLECGDVDRNLEILRDIVAQIRRALTEHM